ncbi:MAG: hypothetical protein RLY43_1901 [Bacteroidota bacterium]|jgi:hypothetical protein
MSIKLTTTSDQFTNDSVVELPKLNLQLFADEAMSSEFPALGETEQTNTGDSVISESSTDESTDDSTANTENTEISDTDTDEKPNAPTDYEDFKALDGLIYDTESATEFKDVAKELNLTQDQAQKLVDLYGKNILAQQEQQQEQSNQWFNESKKQYKQSEIDLASKTIGRFADKETIDLLGQSGLGNHPKMIGLFKKIGEQISEGKMVDAGTTPKEPNYYPGLPQGAKFHKQ